MPMLRIHLDGDGVWPDLAPDAGYGRKKFQKTEDLEVAALAAGMQSGAPSIVFRVTCPDGRVVLAETSLALLLTAADAFKARYGDPRQRQP